MSHLKSLLIGLARVSLLYSLSSTRINMKLKLMALLVLASSFIGCSQAEQVKEQVQNAPSDFWAGLHTVLAYIVDVVSGVALGWIRGLLGL